MMRVPGKRLSASSLRRRFAGSAPLAVVGGGLLGLSASVNGAGLEQWLRSYLVAWLFFASIALGCLFFVLTQHVARAGWSAPVRRLAEHAMATLPIVAVLFVPIALGLGRLYPWLADSAHELGAKSAYLDRNFFLARSAVYLGLWSAFAVWLRRRSLDQDRTHDAGSSGLQRAAAAPALALLVVSSTFAAFDWIMSLDPHWYSTIYGVYFLSGAVVAGLSSLIIVAVAVERRTEPQVRLTPGLLHDLGKLLFAAVVFWAYIAFSQFMLIWYANLPEETPFFAARLSSGWLIPTQLLVLVHFVVPFFYLLPRFAKRRRVALALAAAWMLGAHYFDLFWLVMPGLQTDGPTVRPLDLGIALGVGCLFAAALSFLMLGRSTVATGDPRLRESLAAAESTRTRKS